MKRSFPEFKVNSINVFQYLFGLASKREILIFVIATLGAFGSGACSNLKEGMSGRYFSKLTESKTRHEMISGVEDMCVIYLVMGFSQFLSAYLMNSLICYYSKQIGRKYKVEYFSLVMSMSQSWFDSLNKTSHEFGSQIFIELESIQDSLGMVIGNILSGASAILVGVIVSFCLSWKITLILFVVYPFWIALQFYIVYAVTKAAVEKKSEEEKVNGYIEEILYKFKTIISFVNFDYEKEKIESKLLLGYMKGRKFIIKTSLSMAAFIFLIYFIDGIAFIFGGMIISNNPDELNVSDLYCIISLIVFAGLRIAEMVPNIRRLITSINSAKFFFALKQYRKELDEYELLTRVKKKILENVRGEISFKNVSFSYPKKKEDIIINNLSLVFPQGKTTAIVGESGCGKSTIVSLIEQIYSPNSGEILLDGNNISEIDLEFYRDQIGYVNQEPVLFNDTIRNNIIFGRDLESEEELKEAVKKGGVAEFVSSFKDGLDHIVGLKGNKISGGQKQRIAIARAILKKPKILIFDEATSALDNKSEKMIQNTINSLKGDATIIIIAHRLSTIQNADKIIVLCKGGKITEEGSHEELVNKKGKYYELLQEGKAAAQKEQKEEIIEEKPEYEETITNLESEKRPLNEKADVELMVEVKNKKKPQPKDDSMKKFFKIVSVYKINFIFSLLLAVLSGALNPVGGTFLGRGLGSLYTSTLEDIKKNGIKSGGYVLIVSVFALVIEFFRYYFFDILGEKLNRYFKKEIFGTYLRLHPGYYDEPKHTPGNLVSEMTIRTASINGVILTLLGMLIQASATVLVSTIIGLVIEYRVTLVNLAFFPVFLIVNYVLVTMAANEQKRKQDDNYGDAISENLANVVTIAALNAKQSVCKRFEKIVNKDKNYLYRSQINGIFFGINMSIIFFDYSAAFYTVGHCYANGDFKISDFLRAYGCVMSATYSFGEAIKYIKDITQMQIAVRKLFAQIEIKSEIDPDDQRKDLVSPSHDNFKGKIEFKDVSFAYPSNKTNEILTDISFLINPQDKVGIIGASGKGKSTIVQLIERFYDVSNGDVLIDDIPIKDYSIKSLRKLISFVQQEPVLFSGDVYNNIKYGNLSSTDEEIKFYAQKCKIDHKLFEDSSTLSGGEKQRVAIARALIRKPKILLLDEATSALDNKTEGEVQEMIDKVIKEESITVLVIAHRMKAVESCNKCLKIEGKKTLNKINDIRINDE